MCEELKFCIKKSSIQGYGLFTKVSINSGEIICNIKFPAAWRYINHSRNPNADIVKFNNIIFVQAIKQIPAYTEITLDYRNPLNPYKQKDYDFILFAGDR